MLQVQKVGHLATFDEVACEELTHQMLGCLDGCVVYKAWGGGATVPPVLRIERNLRRYFVQNVSVNAYVSKLGRSPHSAGKVCRHSWDCSPKDMFRLEERSHLLDLSDRVLRSLFELWL